MIEAWRKIYSLLDRGERRQLFFLTPMIVLNGVIQTGGVAAVLPLLSLITDPDAIQRNVFLARLYATGWFADPAQFTLFIGGMTLVSIIISNGFAALTTSPNARYGSMRKYTFSVRLVRAYLSKPYTFYIEQNTAGLVKNVMVDAHNVVTGFLTGGLDLITRVVVMLFVLTLLLLIDPVFALAAVGLLGGIYFGLIATFKRKQKQIGDRFVRTTREQYQSLNESFGAIKAVLVSGRQDLFSEQFSGMALEHANNRIASSMISQMPRYALEVLIFGAVVGFALILLVRGENVSQSIPMLGAYAMAAYRLMPHMQQIFGLVNGMRVSAASLDEVYDDLQDAEASGSMDGSAKPLDVRDRIELENVSFRYPGAKKRLFDKLSIRIEARRWVAFVGATGAGKTTLVDIILGLLKPSSGRLLVDGVPIGPDNVRAWQASIGYVPQDIYLLDKSVLENIAFGVPKDEIDKEAVQRAAKAADIHDFIMTLPKKYDTRVGERGVRLSGGQRQRIGIARAIYTDPTVLVLDEATSALDVETERRILTTLRRNWSDRTVIVITHRLSTVKDCDIICMLQEGQVVETGTWDELMAAGSTFAALARERADEPAGDPWEQQIEEPV